MKLWHAKYADTRADGTVVVSQDDFYLPTAADVRRKLAERGVHAIAIVERREALFTWSEVRSRRWQLQLLRALRFQSSTTSAGTALLNIAETEDDPARSLAFLPAVVVLKGGGSFSAALNELKLYDATTIAMLTAGEKAGDLKSVIVQAIEHIEEKARQARIMWTTMGWLSFDLFSVVTTVIGTQVGYIPYLRKSGLQDGAKPHEILHFQKSLDMAEMINGMLMGFSLLVCGFGLWVAYEMWRNRHKRDHFAARILRKTPFIGKYLFDVSFADTCRTMSRLIRGNVPFSQALTIVRELAMDGAVRNYWHTVQDRLYSGLPPQRALAIPPLNKIERDQVSTFQDMEQLAVVMEAISEEKALDSKVSQRRVMMAGIVFLTIMFAAVTLLTIYLVFLQNQGLMDSLNGMKDGL